MADESLKLSIDVDAQQLHNELQKLQNATQQAVQTQLQNTMVQNQQQMMMAMGSQNVMTPGYNPGSVFARQALAQAYGIAGASSSGIYGEPLLYPTTPRSQYAYPTGFIPGVPNVQSQYYRQSVFKGIPDVARSMAGDVIGSTLGIEGFGALASNRLDMPVYRGIEHVSESLGKTIGGLPFRLAENVVRASNTTLGFLTTGATAYSLYNLVTGSDNKIPKELLFASRAMIPLGLAGFLAGQFVENSFSQAREYMNIGQYTRDMMAPTIRTGRLSGGPRYNEIASFQDNLSNRVSKNPFLLREDYNQILQSLPQAGYSYSMNNMDQVEKAIENIGKQVKQLFQIGIKSKDITQSITMMTNGLGMDFTQNPTQTANTMGFMAYSAYQSGRTIQQILPNITQAGLYSAQQNQGLLLGANTYMGVSGITGEIFRMGGIDKQREMLLGGRDNIERNTFEGIMNMQRTQLGQMYNMEIVSQFIRNKGSINFNKSPDQVIRDFSSYVGNNPNDYYDLKYNAPYVIQEIEKEHPGRIAVSSLRFQIEAMRKHFPSGKIPIGTLNDLVTNATTSPEQARALIETIMSSDFASEGGGQSARVFNKRNMIERSRSSYNLLTQRGRAQLKESFFEPIYGALSSYTTRSIGSVSEKFENMWYNRVTGGNIYRSSELGITDRLSTIDISQNLDPYFSKQVVFNKLKANKFEQDNFSALNPYTWITGLAGASDSINLSLSESRMRSNISFSEFEQINNKYLDLISDLKESVNKETYVDSDISGLQYNVTKTEEIERLMANKDISPDQKVKILVDSLGVEKADKVLNKLSAFTDISVNARSDFLVSDLGMSIKEITEMGITVEDLKLAINNPRLASPEARRALGYLTSRESPNVANIIRNLPMMTGGLSVLGSVRDGWKNVGVISSLPNGWKTVNMTPESSRFSKILRPYKGYTPPITIGRFKGAFVEGFKNPNLRIGLGSVAAGYGAESFRNTEHTALFGGLKGLELSLNAKLLGSLITPKLTKVGKLANIIKNPWAVAGSVAMGAALGGVAQENAVAASLLKATERGLSVASLASLIPVAALTALGVSATVPAVALGLGAAVAAGSIGYDLYDYQLGGHDKRQEENLNKYLSANNINDFGQFLENQGIKTEDPIYKILSGIRSGSSVTDKDLQLLNNSNNLPTGLRDILPYIGKKEGLSKEQVRDLLKMNKREFSKYIESGSGANMYKALTSGSTEDRNKYLLEIGKAFTKVQDDVSTVSGSYFDPAMVEGVKNATEASKDLTKELQEIRKMISTSGLDLNKLKVNVIEVQKITDNKGTSMTMSGERQ